MPHTILFVDDESRVLDSLQRALYKEPYEFLCASSADAACALLKKRTVDVVITDQDMPGMTGTAFLSRVRQGFPETVRMILTGKATREVVLQAINEGAVSQFFTKPCNSVELAAALRQALRQKDLLAEARNLLDGRYDQYAQFAEWAGTYPRIMQIRCNKASDNTTTSEEIPLTDMLHQLYSRGAKMVLVVSTWGKNIMPATLQAVQGSVLTINMQHSTVLYKRGERLLVLCAVPPQERYILQVWVEEVSYYYGRLMLQCQDPGSNAQQ